jgi:restriction system protein
MFDIKKLDKNLYSISLTRNENGYNNYLEFISTINEKYSNYAIKINLKPEYLYRQIIRNNKHVPYTLKSLFFKEKQCSGIYFYKQMDYLGYLNCFYVYDFDHIIINKKIIRLKYLGTYAKKLPKNVDKKYFEKEAKEYQKNDIYFYYENTLYVFDNSIYNYSDGEIDNLLEYLEFINIDKLNNGIKLSQEQLLDKRTDENQIINRENKLIEKSKYINKMTGIEFEQYCKEILLNYNWLVRTTKASGDHGIDIIARKNGNDVGIQCKNYITKVGNKAIQEVYTGCHFYDLDIPIIVTSFGFTKQAIQEAEKLGIKIFDINQFIMYAKVK